MTRPVWATVPTQRTVLLVVQNVTSLNRLLDVLPVLAADHRVQCLVTSDLTDPFAEGVVEAVAALGLPAVPWEQAAGMPVDLVLSAGYHGRVTDLAGPVVLLSHGAGFGKFAPADRAGAEEPRAVYGLDPFAVSREGRPLVTALGLPLDEHVATLTARVPALTGRCHVVGDPCLDRLLASVPDRAAHREALGVEPDRPLVVVTSTWGPRGVLGTRPDLPRHLATGLAGAAEVALVVHPNVWSWHGAHQVRAWCGPGPGGSAGTSPVTLVPPLTGWQSAVLGADVVVGDHGSVTVYAAALGIPVVVAATGEGEVVPGSAAGVVVGASDRLAGPGVDGAGRQVLAAVGSAPAVHGDDVVPLVTSAPGSAHARLAELLYGVLRLDPPGAAFTPPLPPLGTGISLGDNGSR